MKTYEQSFPKESGHWYSGDGKPAYEQQNKSSGGTRRTTIRDARKSGLLPSVTTILQASAKPALDRWKQRNAVHAAITTPRMPGETEDAFCERVLASDIHSISDAAKKRGTQIHGAIELALAGKQYDSELVEFVLPVIAECEKIGRIEYCEKVLIGDGYAGKVDSVFINGDTKIVVDFKTANSMPKKQYDEHLLQLSAYAAAIGGKIKTCNIYIDSNKPGNIVTFFNEQAEWEKAYFEGFYPLFKFWQWKNNYNPKNEN